MDSYAGQVEDKIKELINAFNPISGSNTPGTSTGSNTSGGANTGNNIVVSAPTMEKQLNELLKQSTRTNSKMDGLVTNLT